MQLNTIAEVSFNNPERIMELVEAVSKIMRYSIDTQDRFVVLGDEIEIMNSYILIQKAKFGNSFTFLVETDEMILFFRKSSDRITLLVENDGCCLDVSLLVKSQNGVGLNNVSSRLFMEYKRDGLFSITSGIDKFTKIFMIIPNEAHHDGFNS